MKDSSYTLVNPSLDTLPIYRLVGQGLMCGYPHVVHVHACKQLEVIGKRTSSGLQRWTGEGQKQTVDDMLAAALEYYGERGQLDASPVPAALERERSGAALNSPLRYPGKLAADLRGGRLFISDSNNHRWEWELALSWHSHGIGELSPASGLPSTFPGGCWHCKLH